MSLMGKKTHCLQDPEAATQRQWEEEGFVDMPALALILTVMSLL